MLIYDKEYKYNYKNPDHNMMYYEIYKPPRIYVKF